MRTGPADGRTRGAEEGSGALVLTADLGNSRLKLRLWPGRGTLAQLAPLAALDAQTHGDLAGVAGFLAERAVALAALCSVAAPERERALEAALRAAGVSRVLCAPDAGLELDLRAPERLGRDRLFAARGAFELVGGPAIVVDAGTALTVDALGSRAGRGVFLGGAIAPGAALGARALAEHTAALPRVEPQAGAPALGRDTESALCAGLVHGLRGAARELALCVAREARIPGAPVVVTGGAARLLLLPEPFLPCRHDPELVHRGLLAAARAAG
jgi:type III pantothenate kinase